MSTLTETVLPGFQQLAHRRQQLVRQAKSHTRSIQHKRNQIVSLRANAENLEPEIAEIEKDALYKKLNNDLKLIAQRRRQALSEAETLERAGSSVDGTTMPGDATGYRRGCRTTI